MMDLKPNLFTSQQDVRIVKFILVMGICFASTIAFPYSIMQWLMRCNSINFGYFLIPECHNGIQTSPLSWFSGFKLSLLCAGAFWLVIDGSGSFGIFVSAFSLAQAYCLRRYTHYVTCLVVNGPPKNIRHLIFYRQVQILSRYYNQLQQNKLITVVISGIIVPLILSYYAIISVGLYSISTAELLFFVTVAFDGPVCLTVYTTVMGQLYVESKRVGKKVNGRVLSSIKGRKQIKWVVRYVKSLWPVKCYIGYNNFVDELTPLNLLSFCANQIVSLLMLQ